MTSISSEIFLTLIGLVAAGDRPFDAMRHVISQHFFLDAEICVTISIQ